MSQAAGDVSGLQRACEQYGRPIERWIAYSVTPASLAYWQKVTTTRTAEVVLALRRPGDRFLLHTKDFYPSGAYRLLTGGVQPGEDLLAAVQREAFEETGLTVTVERFIGIIHHWFARGEQQVPFASFVFTLAETDAAPEKQDSEERISDYREVTLDGVLEAAEALEALPPDWVDWGRFRAAGHRLLWEVLGGQRSAARGGEAGADGR